MSIALHYALNLLSRREYSAFELRSKMQGKNFSEQEIEQTLKHCQQKNWQNDRRFTQVYVHSRVQRGYGLNRIKQELRHLKGVCSEDIECVLQEIEIDWKPTALNVLKKKFPYFENVSDPKQKQKIWRYMLSHGFKAEDFASYIGNRSDD